jgi:hypothetical protein
LNVPLNQLYLLNTNLSKQKQNAENDPPPPEAKGPIFLPKGNGLGWTLNFDRPVSYFILAAVLAIPVVLLLYLNGVIKF